MTTVDRLNGVNDGLAFKAPCRVATSANITLSGLQTLGSVTTVEDDRVLVKDQTDATENGIYNASSGNWTRARDFDGARDVVSGTMVSVVSGLHARTFWMVTTTGTITPGTTAITFEQAGTIPDLTTPLDFVNLADYGALGDGTDATAAIKLAVVNALATGRKIWVPYGTTGIYVISDTIFTAPTNPDATGGSVMFVGNPYLRPTFQAGTGFTGPMFEMRGSPNRLNATITAITKASPAVVTSAGHGIANGTKIQIVGVAGMIEVNTDRTTYYIVANATTNTFELTNSSGDNINSTAYSTYTRGGSVKHYVIPSLAMGGGFEHLTLDGNSENLTLVSMLGTSGALFRNVVFEHADIGLATTCDKGIYPVDATSSGTQITGITQANPAVVTTAGAHPYTNGLEVYITGVAGMTEVNGNFYTVANVTANTFELSGTNSSGYTAYTGGGCVALSNPDYTLNQWGTITQCQFSNLNAGLDDQQPLSAVGFEISKTQFTACYDYGATLLSTQQRVIQSSFSYCGQRDDFSTINAGAANGLIIGDLAGGSVQQIVIDDVEFDSNKTVNIRANCYNGLTITNTRHIYGSLHTTHGLDWPTSCFVLIGGLGNSCLNLTLDKMICRFDAAGAFQIFAMADADECVGVSLTGINKDNNSGGATITVYNTSQFLESNKNYINDFFVALHTGEVLVSGRNRRAPPVTNPGGRLTLTTSTPVMTTNTNGATTVYYTEYNHRFVPIMNSTATDGVAMANVGAELSNVLANTSTGNAGPAAAAANSNYDFFVWLNSGTATLTRGVAWASATARSTTCRIERINGVWTNSDAISNGPAALRGTYVGTVRTSSTGGAVDWKITGSSSSGAQEGFLGVWNAYNRVQAAAECIDLTIGWTCTSSSLRAANNSTANRISFVTGAAEDAIAASYSVQASSTGFAEVAVAMDSTASGNCKSRVTATSSGGIDANPIAHKQYPPKLGFHYVSAIERGDGTATTTFSTIQNANLTLTMPT